MEQAASFEPMTEQVGQIARNGGVPADLSDDGKEHPMPGEPEIDPAVPPSGSGCVECLALGGWWYHLRRCAHCGHIGCCDSSPSQHASRHAAETSHPVVRSYEPDEDWFWNYATEEYAEGPVLAPPEHRPIAQPVPGPAGRVPRDWERLLH